MRSFQDALKADETHVPRDPRRRPHRDRGESARREGGHRAGAQDQSQLRAGAPAGRRDGARRPQARRGARRRSQRALEGESQQPRGALARGGDRLPRRARPTAFETQVQQVLKINPIYGEVYRVAGDHAARNYRFDEAAALVRRGAGDRRCEHAGARRSRAAPAAHRRRARRAPRPRARLQGRRLRSADVQLADAARHARQVRDDHRRRSRSSASIPSEVAVMREHAIPLAKEALATLSKRYNFTPKGPILIEMFPKHDDFAVRTIGLPGMIGALGACFGRVVTLDSPKARPPGDFNWGETLWHELAHVITLQMSKQPRAAVAHRRHLGVGRAARASRVGPRDGRHLRARAQRRQGAEARRAQRRASAIRR